ncbi:hypothetical protein K439DRAFT_1657366 [Ramaria rubella]|nr:hypothetical protein K439DRAFT_1657366 [Ramaria rubella]
MPMLKTALLNPGVWAYANGLGTYILRVMEASVTQASHGFVTHVRKVFTDFCGHMKKMIHQSTLDKSSIWELGINIAGKDYILDDAHFQENTEHEKSKGSAEGRKSKESFWPEVDHRLVGLRAMGDRVEAARNRLVARILKVAYENDRQMFPGSMHCKAPPKNKGQCPRWQQDMDNILIKGCPVRKMKTMLTSKLTTRNRLLKLKLNSSTLKYLLL